MDRKPNPFLADVFPCRLADLANCKGGDFYNVESVHVDGLAELRNHLLEMGLTVPGGTGSILMLRSPIAGYGKSHLLARLIGAESGAFRFVPLETNRESRPSWVGLLQGVLQSCAQSGSGEGGASFLETMARRLFAEACADLILRGDVPAADPARAIAMLKRDYLVAFDARGGGSEVGRWLAGNFNALLPLMGEVLGSRCVVDVDEVSAWLRVLSSFNVGGHAERKATLNSVSVFSDDPYAESGAKQRLRSFCRLATMCRPLVLVFDHVDALMGAKKDAMQFACMLGDLGEQHFGVGAILPINNDVWTSSFESNLPSALLDRLTSREVVLGGVGADEAEELFALRLAEAEVDAQFADEFFRAARLSAVFQKRWAGAAAPRRVLRHGAKVWAKMMSPSTSPGLGSGESVKDYLPDDIPDASSLAEPTTLEPHTEVSPGSKKMTAKREPRKVDPTTVKQMGNISSILRELRSRQEQFVPRDLEGGEQLPPSVDMPDAGDSEPEGTSPLVARFEEIRSSILDSSGGGQLDLEALRRMVTLAGERFPMVESSEFKMTPGDEPMVRKWVFPGNEILFGFEPEHQFRFWQSLIKLAERRSGSAAAERVKLVVFSETGRPFSGAASIDEEELAAAKGECLDVIDLDAGSIASILAADRVVTEMAKAEEPVLPVEAIRELAPQLDPLWRRITRPLPKADAAENNV